MQKQSILHRYFLPNCHHQFLLGSDEAGDDAAEVAIMEDALLLSGGDRSRPHCVIIRHGKGGRSSIF